MNHAGIIFINIRKVSEEISNLLLRPALG